MIITFKHIRRPVKLSLLAAIHQSTQLVCRGMIKQRYKFFKPSSTGSRMLANKGVSFYK
jgi:hypothetical protein